MPTPTQTLHADIAALLPRLRRFARSLTWSREDADDLAQLALERALQRSGQWQQGTRLDSWIFRIMKNAWIDVVRGRARRARLFVPEAEGEQVGDDTARLHQHRLALRQALGMLNEEQRKVIGLVLVEGLPYKEAARVLRIPVGTLTSRLARARGVLRTLL